MRQVLFFYVVLSDWYLTRALLVLCIFVFFSHWDRTNTRQVLLCCVLILNLLPKKCLFEF